MPFLTVLGDATWMSGGVRYAPGSHQVSKAVAEEAIRSGIPRLVVSARKPATRRGPTPGPLRHEDMDDPEGVKLGAEPPEPETEPEPVIPDPYEVPLEHECKWCDWAGPSGVALLRHVEVHHGELAASELEPLPEPEPVPTETGAGPLPERDPAVD